MIKKHRKSSVIGALLSLLLFSQCPLGSKETCVVLSKNLTVMAFEFGKFKDGHSPSDHTKGAIEFEPLKKPVANTVGYSYGYRILVKSPEALVRVLNSSSLIPRDPPKGRGQLVKIDQGAIYYDWPIDGFSNGKYLVKVWINDLPLPPLRYEIDFR